MEHAYEVNPGTCPSTRTIADAGAVAERARYYAGKVIPVWIYRFTDSSSAAMRRNIREWEYCYVREYEVKRDEGQQLLSATDDASAIAEAWPDTKPAATSTGPSVRVWIDAKTTELPKPAPATDPAMEWAETNVTRKKTAFPEWLHVEAGFASLYLTVPARGCGHDIGDLRRLVAAIFRAGQAHERARVEGLLTAPHDIGDGYPHGQLMDDIRSGRDLRKEAKQ